VTTVFLLCRKHWVHQPLVTTKGRMKRILVSIIIIFVTNQIFSQAKSDMAPEDIIEKFEHLEYFKFLNEEDILLFKSCLIENIKNGWLDMPNQVLLDLKRGNGLQRDKPESIDKRSCVVNGEYIFRGGLETILNKFQPIFESRELKLTITENSEIYTEDYQFLNHKITVNERTYQIFDGKLERGDSEMEYLKSLINLLNNELKEQGYSKEQFKVLTSMETLYYLLIDKETVEFINNLDNIVNSKIIDLEEY